MGLFSLLDQLFFSFSVWAVRGRAMETKCGIAAGRRRLPCISSFFAGSGIITGALAVTRDSTKLFSGAARCDWKIDARKQAQCFVMAVGAQNV